MPILLLTFLFCTKIYTSDGAPKLGDAQFDPLLFDANKNEINSPQKWDEPLDIPPKYGDIGDDKLFEDPNDDDDYLEYTVKEDTTPTSRVTPTSSRTLNRLMLLYQPTEAQTTTEQTSTDLLIEENNADVITRSSCSTCAIKSDNQLANILREGEELITGTDSIKKSGYDYDERICKMINNRILCGYNKNLGEIPNKEAKIAINKECTLRNDRIECGYVIAKEHDLVNSEQINIPPKPPAKPYIPNTIGELYDVHELHSQGLRNKPSTPLVDKSVVFPNANLSSSETYQENHENLQISSQEPELKIIKTQVKTPYVNSLYSESTLGTLTTSSVSTLSRNETEGLSLRVGNNTDNLPSEVIFDDNDNTSANIKLVTPQLLANTASITALVENENFVAEIPDSITKDGEQSSTTRESILISNNMNLDINTKDDNFARAHIESESNNKTPGFKQVTRCVEIGDRIVCYNIRLSETTVPM